MKKYSLILAAILVLMLAACSGKNTISGVNISSNSQQNVEEVNFNDTLSEWWNKISYMASEYGEGYKVENNLYKDYKDKVDGINLMRSDWDSFNRELQWNPQTTKDRQILDSVEKINHNFKMAMEYKSNYFNGKNSSDLSMMRKYEQDCKNELSYFGTLTGY